MDWVKKKKDFGYAFRNVWITGKEEEQVTWAAYGLKVSLKCNTEFRNI